MGGAFIKEGMAAEDWLRSKRQTYIFWGFLAVLGVLVVLATLTIQEAQAKSSRDELVSILTDRSENVVELIDSLLAPQEQYETFFLDAHGAAYEEGLRLALTDLKSDFEETSGAMLASLRNGNAVRAHELGNEINSTAARIGQMVTGSEQRSKTLSELQARLSLMSPFDHSMASQWVAREELRVTNLKEVSQEMVSLLETPPA